MIFPTALSKYYFLFYLRSGKSNRSTASIPIEHRPWIEACLVPGAVYPPPEDGKVEQKVVQLTPPGLGEKNVYNPSFDVTPAELISAIVTEKGVETRRENGTFDLSPIV